MKFYHDIHGIRVRYDFELRQRFCSSCRQTQCTIKQYEIFVLKHTHTKNTFLYDVQYMKRALKQYADNTGPDQPAHSMQADLGLQCTLPKSMDTVVCVDEQRMSRLDYNFSVRRRHMGLFPTLHIIWTTSSKKMPLSIWGKMKIQISLYSQCLVRAFTV